MNESIRNYVKQTLCPDGIWQLSPAMKSLLRYQIGRLPNKSVSENETRYPETPGGMRAFLNVFFTRHFFQVQNSLFKYLVSQEGLRVLTEGRLRILDIGSGPAVASLAITDMVACIAENLVRHRVLHVNGRIRITYVLNDTESICLAVAQDMIEKYFKISGAHQKRVTGEKIFTSQTGFPQNMK